jgi:hypothetical protein
MKALFDRCGDWGATTLQRDDGRLQLVLLVIENRKETNEEEGSDAMVLEKTEKEGRTMGKERSTYTFEN